MNRASSATKWLVTLIGSVALLLWASPSHWSKTGLAASVRAGAPASSGPLRSAKTMSPGITLTLTVPRGAYARNALARVTLKIENVSPYDVSIPNSCVPEMRVPFAEAVTSGGKMVFPFALPDPQPSSPCMTSPQTQLPRGSALTRHEYVIVRAAQLRGVGAFIHVGGTGPSSGQAEHWLYTPPIDVALLRGHAPRVTLVDSPVVRASVHPAEGQQAAHLYYTDWYRCASVGGIPEGHWGRWVAAPWDDVLTPGCDHPLEWHAAVASLNQPVAYINYTSPSSSR